MGNAFSSSAKCTDAANKPRRHIFMIRLFFQDLSKQAFLPFYGAWVRPHLECGVQGCSPNLMADINHLEKIQSLATRLVTSLRRLPYENKPQRPDLNSLHRQ